MPWELLHTHTHTKTSKTPPPLSKQKKNLGWDGPGFVPALAFWHTHPLKKEDSSKQAIKNCLSNICQNYNLCILAWMSNLSLKCPSCYLLVIFGSNDSFNVKSFVGFQIILSLQMRMRKLIHSHCVIFLNKKLWGTKQQQKSENKDSILSLATGHWCNCGWSAWFSSHSCLNCKNSTVIGFLLFSDSCLTQASQWRDPLTMFDKEHQVMEIFVLLECSKELQVLFTQLTVCCRALY